MSDTSHHHHTEAYRRGDRSPEALEHEVDAERNNVARTIDALQEKLSVSGMVDEAVRAFQRHGGGIGRNLGRRVSENPLPVILTGIGLAWLMVGSGSRRSRGYYGDDYAWDAEADLYDDDLYDEEYVGTRRYGAAGTRPYGTAAVGGTYGGSSGPSAADRMKGAASSMADRASGAARSMSDRASGAAHSASDSARHAGSSAYGSASHAAGSAYGSASHAAGSAAHGAGRMAGSASESARGAGSAASHGVSSAAGGVYSAASSAAETVGDAARYAGDSLSRGAYEARERAAYYGRYTQRRASDMVEEHPLVVGALAFAIGAAIGGALPRTRTEDEYLGEYSDEAWHAARDMAESEAEKARRVAGAVADEAREIVDEKRSEAEHLYEEGKHQAKDMADRAASQAKGTVESARDEGKGMAEKARHEVEDAAGRIGERAKSEAEKQNLGKPTKHS